MRAYLIADVEVNDPEPYAEHRRRFDPILERYDGRILVAGGAVEPLEGDWRPVRPVILEFPSADHARRRHASPQEAEIAPIRHRHATTHFLPLVEGWAGAEPTARPRPDGGTCRATSTRIEHRLDATDGAESAATPLLVLANVFRSRMLRSCSFVCRTQAMGPQWVGTWFLISTVVPVPSCRNGLTWVLSS